MHVAGVAVDFITPPDGVFVVLVVGVEVLPGPAVVVTPVVLEPGVLGPGLTVVGTTTTGDVVPPIVPVLVVGPPTVDVPPIGFTGVVVVLTKGVVVVTTGPGVVVSMTGLDITVVHDILLTDVVGPVD